MRTLLLVVGPMINGADFCYVYYWSMVHCEKSNSAVGSGILCPIESCPSIQREVPFAAKGGSASESQSKPEAILIVSATKVVLKKNASTQ